MMFDSNDAFKNWLSEHAEASFSTAVAGLDDQSVNTLHQVFEKYGDANSSDMMALSGTLGESIPMMINAVKSSSNFADKSALKSFVTEGAVALYRLMDRGASGTGRQLSDNQDPIMAGLFPNGGMEESFVRPMASQAVDSSFQVFGI